MAYAPSLTSVVARVPASGSSAGFVPSGSADVGASVEASVEDSLDWLSVLSVVLSFLLSDFLQPTAIPATIETVSSIATIFFIRFPPRYEIFSYPHCALIRRYNLLYGEKCQMGRWKESKNAPEHYCSGAIISGDP